MGCSINPLRPRHAVIEEIRRETPDTATYTLAFSDVGAEPCRFRPGQFNMVGVFGVGEAPISISSLPEPEGGSFRHTVRRAGNVTQALERLRPGDTVGVRGPYGNGWPLETIAGRNLLVVAGGIGLAPLRPLIEKVLADRNGHQNLEVLYGARTPADILFKDDLERWHRTGGATVALTVDTVPEGSEWNRHVGVVTRLFGGIRSSPEDTIVTVCGPEVMMRFAVGGLLEMGFTPQQIHVSLERRMHCGLAECGSCQIGPWFVCRDGPVFSYATLLSSPERPF